MNTATIRTIMEMENTLKAVVLIIGNQEADNEEFDRDFADYVELISKGTEHIYKRVTQVEKKDKDYVTQIEVVIEDLDAGIMDPFEAGVTAANIVADIPLNYNEIAVIEEELNKRKTSMYKEIYFELNPEQKFLIGMDKN